MSYTPPEQLMEDKLLTACTALAELEKPIRERLKNPEEWKQSHLAQLSNLLQRLVIMQTELYVMAGNVR